jgi:hypothetical protein
MLNGRTPGKLIAPRRQERKGKNIFPELGAFASLGEVFLVRFLEPNPREKFKYPWLGLGCIFIANLATGSVSGH